MKAGDKWKCPKCGDTTLVKKNIYDGFTKTGEVLQCVFCGTAVPQDDTSEESNKQGKPSAWASVFGEETNVKKSQKSLDDIFGKSDDGKATLKEQAHALFGDASDCQFCRDCKNRAVNAFKIFCVLHQKDVEPLDSCPDFSRIKPHDTEK